QCDTYRRGMQFGLNVWCIVGVPVAKWATTVFPELSEAEAVYRLWLAILSTARADGEDPESDWETHNASFEKIKRFMNEHCFDAIRYTSSNGTDLTVGMNKGHIWEGGSARTVDGTVFFPNMPTEEVFTSPDRMRADGIVHSAMPLVHAGQVVRDFWFRFKGGAVVDYGAAQGADVLKSIVERDENAVRLGECALISKNTPIRQSGTLFFNTLYDENASCHLALGTGFPECLQGGLDMTKDEIVERGVNQSAVHVDFMIGSDDLSIVGIADDGTETRIFVNGQWVWE
ncbi:MAG: aminopeptidase, partial [Atopobiaceae bacterium]|nr:aminopeptidase [Atopobiaceae bacterium]